MKIKHLILIGVALILASLAFDIMFIGIPPQDPSAEMILKRNRLYSISSKILYSGFFLLAVSLLLLIGKKVRKQLN